MAVGVPVISSNAGGIPEVNIQGETGFLSDVGNVEDMARNAVYILSSDQILEKFKKNARRRANDFDLEKILPMYEKLYEEVLIKPIIR